jgi:hypothetical protein
VNPNKSPELIDKFNELLEINKQIEIHHNEVFAMLELENAGHLKLQSTVQNKLSFKVPYTFLSRIQKISTI